MDTENLTIDQLQAWVRSGGHWRVVDISRAHVAVDLCACTGEALERAESDDATVIDYLRTAEPAWALDQTSERSAGVGARSAGGSE